MALLTSTDIRNVMKGDSRFLGVFPINKVNTFDVPSNRAVTFIDNLQAYNLPGNHWVAVLRNANNTAEFFDSFGTIPPAEIQHWMMQNASTWTWNTKKIQKKNDKSS